MKLLKEAKKKPVPKEKKKEQKMFEEKEMFEILQSSYQVKVFSPRICCRECDSKIRKIKNTRRKIWSVNSIKNHFSSNNKYKENHQIADVIYTEPHNLLPSFAQAIPVAVRQNNVLASLRYRTGALAVGA